MQINELYSDYLFGKQTIEQLGKKLNLSSKTIRIKLDLFENQRITIVEKNIIVLMDTTY